jgi:hypothetical protein
MGVSTLLIAFLPTYAMVGWIAPLLLCVLRFGQGFGLGGEWGGATLLAVENAPKGWEARFGSAPQLGAPVGFPRRERAVPAARLGPCRTRNSPTGVGVAVPAFSSARRYRAVGAAEDRRDAGFSRGAREGAAAARNRSGTVLRHHWAPTLAASAGVVSGVRDLLSFDLRSR